MSFPYQYHIFICQNQRPLEHPFGCCYHKGSEEILTYVKKRVRELNIDSSCISKSGCLGECKQGPVVVVYPEGIWYRISSVEEAEQMIQSHLLNHQPTASLRLTKKEALRKNMI